MSKFKSPPIPASIRNISHPLYRNIFSYNLGNSNLWGTETLFGDWDGKFLLIAKDFYPTSYIEGAIAKLDPHPYQHSPSAPTNRNLVKTLCYFERVAESFDNTDCNFLYISACFLLRADGVVRGKLPDQEVAMRLSAPVVRFTMDHMRYLKVVVAMGADAVGAIQASGLASEISGRGLKLHSVSHPSRAMTDDRRFEEWRSVL